MNKNPCAIFVFFLSVGIQGCSITRPCTEAGDLEWTHPIKGDRYCSQKPIKMKDGEEKWVNHGRYRQLHSNGKLAIEGHFNLGQKTGTWVEYNEEGKEIQRRYFEEGLEVFPDKQKLQKEIRAAQKRNPYLKDAAPNQDALKEKP